GSGREGIFTCFPDTRTRKCLPAHSLVRAENTIASDRRNHEKERYMARSEGSGGGCAIRSRVSGKRHELHTRRPNPSAATSMTTSTPIRLPEQYRDRTARTPS